MEVTSNSVHPNHHPKYLLDIDQNNFYSTKNSFQDAWICFNFKNRKINPLNYLIKSCNNDSGKGHQKIGSLKYQMMEILGLKLTRIKIVQI